MTIINAINDFIKASSKGVSYKQYKADKRSAAMQRHPAGKGLRSGI